MNRTSLALLALATLAGAGCMKRDNETEKRPAPAAEAPAADNTGINERDRAREPLTPGDQPQTGPDLKITQEVRQAVVGDDRLSTTAKNVKIITNESVVTLRGPVQSAAEKDAVGAAAKQVTGVTRVDNQLEVVASK